MPIPTLDPDALQTLEDSIGDLTGVAREAFYDTSIPNSVNGATVRNLLRQWLLGKGVHSWKVANASTTVLVNAYRVGDRYIDKMNESPDRPRPDRPRPDLNLPTDLLFERLKPAYPPEARKDESPAIDLGKISAESLARAADAVLGPKFDSALRRLTTEVASAAKLAAAVERKDLEKTLWDGLTGLADDLRSSVKGNLQLLAEDTANKVARKVVEENLPRRLEIRLPNRPPRLLSAAPRHKIFDKALSRLAIGRHVYMVGGAGTGKTHLFNQLGEALDRPITIFSQLFTKYDLSGHKSPTGEMINTPLREAVENGHLTCFDEIDMSAAAAVGFLNSLTANRYVAFPDKLVTAHPNFVVLAAANTTGHGATRQFVGRNPLDAASLDRFTYIECDYDPSLEQQIYGTSPWVLYCQRVRAAVNDLKLPHIISMRAIERCLDGLALGDSPEEIAQDGLWRTLSPDTISKIKSIAGEPPALAPPAPPAIDLGLEDAAD